MKRTNRHPDTVRQSVIRFVQEQSLIRPGDHIIAAVSGGVDSMVMLELLATLRRRWNLIISVAHMNHGLRGNAADLDEQLVQVRAGELGVPFYSERVSVKKLASVSGQSVQTAAREARYGFLQQLKRVLKADRIATAHHAGDNAETILFNILRGTGLQGLTGIPAHRDGIIRPMLILRREDIAAFAAARSIPFREDASNAKSDYSRNFLRQQVIPKLEKRINPALIDTLGKEAELFASLNDFVVQSVAEATVRVVKSDTLSVKELNGLPLFLRRSVVKGQLERSGVEPSVTAVNRVLELMERKKGSTAEVSGNLTAELTVTGIVLRSGILGRFACTLAAPGTVKEAGFEFSVKASKKGNIRKGHPSKEYVDAEKLRFPLTVRSWEPGDSFIPLGMKGKKKLSDLFGERKLTSEQKAAVPVILSGDIIVWVGGIRLDDRFKITKTTRSFYQLTLRSYGKTHGHRQ